MKALEESPWKILHENPVYDNPWISLSQYSVVTPSGTPGIYGKVHFKNKAIGILAVDEHHHIWLVGQWRFPLGAWSWEIPEGGGPTGSDPLDTARRELKEETGLVASQWSELLRSHLSNSVSDEEGIIYLAQGLEQFEVNREETEADMKVVRLPFIEAFEMVMEGKITDSLSMMAILKAAHLHPEFLHG
jgi:8-oxo-dGTP pyrophosphatase MutT (NUDIX family)